MILSNPHTHTQYVDGKSTAREMVARAFALGFKSLGFSEHASQPFDPEYSLSRDGETAYISEIESLKNEYSGKMRIWRGIERDRLSNADRTKYEYILAASHYLDSENGEHMAVDGNADDVEKFVEAHFKGSWQAAFEMYFSSYAEYVESVKPDIIAHFDLIAKNNRRKNWFSEDDKAYISAGNAALKRMIRVCPVLEVNTGGIARSGQPVPYPIKPFLKTWRDLGGSVIPSSDCHRAQHIDVWFENMPEYLKSCGFDSCLMLAAGEGKGLFERIPLN